MDPTLHVVMYHYIRDLPNTPFPRLRGMLLSDFQRQLATLQDCYEMATLESTLAFLQGTYAPPRNLCLLTFDDGLKEHYTDVTPLLANSGIQGIFFPITSCLQEYRVASVHMNHFLMAALDFAVYQRAFLERLDDLFPRSQTVDMIDAIGAQRTYRWDSPEVASFKYLFNFVLDWDVRDQTVKTLFEEHIANERSFSQTLYLNWEEARQMQGAGMLIGGHSHQHRPLAALPVDELQQELLTCRYLLVEHLQPQSLWPFSYPYGKNDSFNSATVKYLKQLEFTCAFCTEVGFNLPGTDSFAVHRVDCKDASSQ